MRAQCEKDALTEPTAQGKIRSLISTETSRQNCSEETPEVWKSENLGPYAELDFVLLERSLPFSGPH